MTSSNCRRTKGRDNTLLRRLRRRLTSCSSERINRSIASFSIVLKWQIHVINSIQCSSISILVESFRKKNSKTLDIGKVYSRMWHWGISVKTMPQNIFVSALFPPQRPLLCRGEAKKTARERRPHGLATLWLWIPSKSLCGGERLVRQKRGAQMIWNKHRTLFIRVRIDLAARLIITLIFTSEGEISWCYCSNQTSLVKRLHSTRYFLHFTNKIWISAWLFFGHH